MQYRAIIAHDMTGAQHDVRTVEATRIDVLEKRMTAAARDLLETYYKLEVKRQITSTFAEYKPLPLVRFDGALRDIARHARNELKRTRASAVSIGDTRWNLSPPLDRFTANVTVSR